MFNLTSAALKRPGDYQPLTGFQHDESNETQKPFDKESERSTPAKTKVARSSVLIFLCTTNAGFVFIILVLAAAMWQDSPTNMECAKKLSPYSPMFEAVEYYETDFDNAFAHPSVYRGPPTPELEDAWFHLWNRGSIYVLPEGIDALNKTWRGSHHHSYPPDGSERYGALIEMFHQLHCLVRSHSSVYMAGSLFNSPGHPLEPVGARMHTDHCIESLRLSLMCYGDITPVLIEEDPTAPGGRRADFNVHHICRDYDKIGDWVEQNGPGAQSALKPHGIVVKGY